MQRTFIALGCALALAAGTTLAQQQQPGQSSGSSGTSLTDKAKQAAQAIGDKTRETAEKVKDKTQQTAQKSDDSTKSMGASGSGAKDTQQMQKQADADYKSAKAQCEPIQQKPQKTLCEKQATAVHANAEVEIEKARVAQGGNTSAMGAGKSSQ